MTFSDTQVCVRIVKDSAPLDDYVIIFSYPLLTMSCTGDHI